MMCSTLVVGCIVEAPAQLSERAAERPNLVAQEAEPSVSDIVSVESEQTLPLNIPYEVVDNGETYIAQLWLDWELDGERLLFQQPIAPLDSSVNTSDERQLILSLEIDARFTDGCHVLTLFLTPRDNIADDTAREPEDFSLVGSTTWWVNVNATLGEQRDLLDCPTKVTGTALESP